MYKCILKCDQKNHQIKHSIQKHLNYGGYTLELWIIDNLELRYKDQIFSVIIFHIFFISGQHICLYRSYQLGEKSLNISSMIGWEKLPWNIQCVLSTNMMWQTFACIMRGNCQILALRKALCQHFICPSPQSHEELGTRIYSIFISLSTFKNIQKHAKSYKLSFTNKWSYQV